MNAAMETVANTLAIGDHFFVNSIATMDDDALRRRVVDNTNSVLWLAGHLLNMRMYLLGLFGDDRKLPWEQKFKDAYDPSADYPSMAELKEKWVSIAEALQKQMRAASDDHFEKAIDWNLPNGDKTVRGACLFYAYHEGWHLGQVAYARKGMGMAGLVPY